MARNKIVVIEDDRDIHELITYNLKNEGYQVISAYDGEQGLFVAQKERPDLVVLDLMLPKMEGLEICRVLKNSTDTKAISIVMLTAKGDESDVIVGLQMGADDYLTKPFSVKVLLARIKAVIRRGLLSGETQVTTGVRDLSGLVIDLVKHKVSYRGHSILLTAIEFAILDFLSRSPGRVYTRSQILDNVWKDGKFIIDRAVDVHVRGLRKKLDSAAHYIETVRGIGYRFKEVE